MARCCQTQLLAQAAGTPKLINETAAVAPDKIVGSENTSYFSFLPMFNALMNKHPDLFE